MVVPHFRFPRLVLSLGTLLAVPYLQAAEEPKKDEEEELPTMVITASRTAQDQKNVPQSTNVVEQKRIERFQATSPSEMLQEQPGVWVNQVAAQGSPIIRGQMWN